MGLLFGGLLSRRNEVCIYGHHAEKTDDLKKNGVLIREKDGAENHFFPQAAVSGENSGKTPDVVMLFTKSLVSREVLEQNRGLFGPDTLLLTLQNGCGHEELLKEFVDESHVVIGTTRHNSVLTGNTSVLHGGGGATCIGFVHGRNTSVYALGEAVCEHFCKCCIRNFTGVPGLFIGQCPCMEPGRTAGKGGDRNSTGRRHCFRTGKGAGRSPQSVGRSQAGISLHIR